MCKFVLFYYDYELLLIFGIIEINCFSSSNLSFNLLQSLIRWSLSKSNGLNRRSSREYTREATTNERSEVNSLSSRSIMAFCSVRSWLLYTVITQARWIGTCRREQEILDLLSQVRQIGAIGTTLLPSKLVMVRPL